MILVHDTNVLVSSLVFGGAARMFLVESVRRGHVLVTCEPILEELAEVLERPHIMRERLKRGLTRLPVDDLVQACRMVIPEPIHPSVCRDPDDDAILGCAVAAKADCIVTGDTDLLVMKNFHEIEIANLKTILGRIAPVP